MMGSTLQTWPYSSITYIGTRQVPNYMTLERIASQTVNGWMNSPGHRENVLDKGYDREGIGVAIGANEAVYVTQNFC
jgi:uncharacterized protein YkwD